MVQGEINRGRHTDHPSGRHAIRTNQCPPLPSPQNFFQAGCPSCCPTNSVKPLKATSTSTYGLNGSIEGRRAPRLQSSKEYGTLYHYQVLSLRNAHMCVLCAYHCSQLSYTTQHRTVLIIFPLPVHPRHGWWTTAVLRWMMQTKGIPAGQRKGSGCANSQTYQGTMTKYE